MAARIRDRRSVMAVIDDLTTLWEPRIRDAFYVAISDIVDNVSLNQIADAIETGDVERVFRMLGFNERSLQPIIAEINNAYAASQMGVFRTFPIQAQNNIVRGVFRTDSRNVAAERWLSEHSSTLIVNLTNEARETTRQVLAAGMERGDNPRKTALDLVGRKAAGSSERVNGLIGLSPGQERWVEGARQQLSRLDKSYFNRELRDKRFDTLIAKAITNGRSLTGPEIERIIGAYTSNVLRYRGESIGRTESTTALNAGAWQSIQEAIDGEQLTRDQVTRVWDATGDGRTRRTHRLMEGQQRALDEPFNTPGTLLRPGGYQLMFPGDSSLGAPAEETIMCRCRVKIVIDWLDNID